MPSITASLVGIPSKTTWTSTASFKYSAGELFCVCAASGTEVAPHHGRKLIRLLEGLQPNDGQIVFQAVNQFLEEEGTETDFSLAVVWKEGSTVLLLTYGFAMIGLLRGDSARWLMDGTQSQQVLQGSVGATDVLVLATARMRDLPLSLPHFIRNDPDMITAELFARVQKHPHSGELGLLAIQHGSSAVAGIDTSTANDEELEAGEENLNDYDDDSNESLVVSAPVILPPSHVNIFSGHLISPDKIQAGISAASVETPIAGAQRFQRHKLLSLLESIRFERLHAVRIGLALVVGAIIIGSILGFRSWNIQKEYREVVQPLEQMVSETTSLPTEKRFEQRAAAESLLERLRATKLSYNSNRRQLQQLTAQMESLFSTVSAEKAVVNLPVFYDFRLVSSEFIANRATREETLALFIDTAKNRLMSIDLGSKKNESIPLEGVSDVRDLVHIKNLVYTVSSQGVYRSRVSGSDLTQIATAENFSEPSAIEAFGDSLYVLDRGKQQIWRLAQEPTEGDSASPSAWVRSARGIDFSTITSLAIDGSVWLGNTTGAIFKLSRGERENFSVVGLPDPFTSSIMITAVPEGTKLVVVEPGRQRIVVFNKETGEYVQQISSEQIGAATDLFMSADEMSLYLVAGSVVYKVEI